MRSTNTKIYKCLTEEIVSEWKDLWIRSEYSHFYNSYEFFTACLKAFNIKDYYLFTVETKERIIAIFPLIKTRKFGINVFTSPGKRFLEKSTLLYMQKDEKVLTELFKFIASKGNIYFTEIEKDLLDFIEIALEGSLKSLISVNPYIQLNSDPFLNMSKKNLSRFRNRISKNIKFVKYYHNSHNFKKALKMMIDIENRSSKGIKGKSIFKDSDSKNFYKALISEAEDCCMFDYLTYKGIPFVYAFGVTGKDIYYAYQTAFLYEYKELIPGKLLLYFLFPKLKNEDYKIFDFVRGYSFLKKEFSNGCKLQYDIYFSNSFSALFYWKCINLLRRIRILLVGTENSLDYKYLFRTHSNYSDPEYSVQKIL